MRAHPAGRDSAVIGRVVATPARRLVLATASGGERVVDLLFGEQLPRICRRTIRRIC
jgi:hydrogenase expression/formation protein HypE